MTLPIEVTNLTKQYDNVRALSEISFTVQPGEIMGFLGPNGAGKTTTMRILTGMVAPTSGTVKIDGLSVADHPVEARKRLGYLPEHAALYPELRVQEYLRFRASIKGVPARQCKERLTAVLEQCDLTTVSRRLIGRLSKGFRQRVALADALIAQPKILILDEPTVGLDPHQIRQTRELITRLGQSATILLSTHILPEVEMLCHRVTIVHQGRIVAVDTPAQLRQRLRGVQVLRIQLKAAPAEATQALHAIPGILRVSLQGQTEGYATFELEVAAGQDVREAIFQLAVSRSWTLRELAQLQASLEDVFIRLTTNEPDLASGSPA